MCYEHVTRLLLKERKIMNFTQREIVAALGGMVIGVGVTLAGQYMLKQYKAQKSNKGNEHYVSVPGTGESDETEELTQGTEAKILTDVTAVDGYRSPLLYPGGREEFENEQHAIEKEYWATAHNEASNYIKELRSTIYPEFFVDEEPLLVDEDHQVKYAQYICWMDSNDDEHHPYTEPVEDELTWIRNEDYDPTGSKEHRLVWCRRSQVFVDLATNLVNEDITNMFAYEDTCGDYLEMLTDNTHFDNAHPKIHDDVSRPPVWYGPVLCFQFYTTDPDRPNYSFQVTTADETVKSYQMIHDGRGQNA